MIKTDFLESVERRLERARELLLPEIADYKGIHVGVFDPESRLSKIVGRVTQVPRNQFRNDVEMVCRLLIRDIPELIQGVRDMKRERDEYWKRLDVTYMMQRQLIYGEDGKPGEWEDHFTLGGWKDRDKRKAVLRDFRDPTLDPDAPPADYRMVRRTEEILNE